MDKIIISVDSCRSGYIVADDIYSFNGALLVTKRTEINEYIIDKLRDVGISEVTVYSHDLIFNSYESHYEKSYKITEANYLRKVQDIKDMINDIAVGREIKYEVISQIADDLYSEIDNKWHVISCLSSIKAFDQYTYNHSVNVSLYCMLLAKWLNYSEKQIKEILIAGLLHDIGKAKIPRNILNKSGKLSNEEFEIMKNHSIYGYEIVKSLPFLSQEIMEGILYHHEKDNGTGYPLGLTGDKINHYAKIIAVADVYDALTSERVYKKRLTPFDTFSIFESSGIGHFDPKIMMTFLHNIPNYYIGAEVMVNTGNTAQVVYVAPHNISMPVIRMDHEYIDIASQKELKIINMIG